jgi:hypothetical protein
VTSRSSYKCKAGSAFLMESRSVCPVDNTDNLLKQMVQSRMRCLSSMRCLFGDIYKWRRGSLC